ncbi:hypothetical protein [Cupriavidus sp. amp6]|uniref:hypothetical protein n=1 Tax=Cupriavidus sp. amp6 TaxID=388051 RepID=UPI0012EC0AB5|nr:hypothetical protein [Cupriavidus sp. amp6]
MSSSVQQAAAMRRRLPGLCAAGMGVGLSSGKNAARGPPGARAAKQFIMPLGSVQIGICGRQRAAQAPCND